MDEIYEMLVKVGYRRSNYKNRLMSEIFYKYRKKKLYDKSIQKFPQWSDTYANSKYFEN